MTAKPTHCPKCSRPLPRDAPKGLCPECLLLGGFESAAEAAMAQPGDAAGEGTIHIVVPVDEPAGGVPETLRCFGNYELLEQIAVGGMGVVFKARQVSLNRLVAVKMIRGGQLAREAEIRRFRTEAEATANLKHPHIVAIHEVGEHQGQHYFSMDFIEGRSLAALVRDGPLEPARAARLVRTVAEAIGYAHQRGVLHRDLKPSNVMIDTRDEPHVTDFGLAKLLKTDSELTHSGAVLGSPSYMSPEQARGRAEQIGVRSDVYALGAMLYELLTDHAPFRAATPLETMKLVIDQEPPSPRVLNPALPRDLETIALKCLAKQPSARYGTAQELADELARFLADEPILARPLTAAERAWRWSRRQPAWAALLTAGVVMPLVFVALLLAKNAQVRHEAKRATDQETRATNALGRAESEAQRANDARAEARQNLYAADMLLAQHALDDGNLGLARRLVLAWQPHGIVSTTNGVISPIRNSQLATRNSELATRNSPDLRGFEWPYLWQRCQGDERHTLYGHSNGVHCVAFSRDGHRLASGDAAGRVKLWDVDSCQAIATLAVSQSPIVRVSFSADGQALATADERGGVLVWNLTTSKAVWSHQDGYPNGVELAPVGTRIGISRKEPDDEFGRTQRSAWVWDCVIGKAIWHLDQADFEAFSAAGKMAIITRRELGSEIWEIETGRLVKTFTNSARLCLAGAMFPSPDGRRLASLCGRPSEFAVVDLIDDKPGVIYRMSSSQASRLAFSPDGSLVAAAATDQTVHLWDGATQRELTRLLGHVAYVTDVTFSPDGRWLATASADQTVKLWSTAWQRRAEVITNLPSESFPRFLLSPDGHTLAGVDRNRRPRSLNRIWRWDVASHQRTLLGEGPSLEPEFFSADSRTLFARSEVTSNGVLPLLRYDVTNPTNPPQRTLLRLQSPIGIAWAVAAPEARIYAVNQLGMNIISLWNPLTGESLGQLRAAQNVWIGSPIGFSADGTKLASFGWPDQIRLIDLAAPDKQFGARLPDKVRGVAFSPDGKNLVVACDDQTIHVFDTERLREETALSGHQHSVAKVAFSPDGRTLAAGSGGDVKLWSWPARREVATVIREAGDVNFIAFTPNGQTLLAGTWTGQIHVWRVPSLAEIDRGP